MRSAYADHKVMGNDRAEESGRCIDVLAQIRWQITGGRRSLHGGEQLLDTTTLLVDRFLQHRDADFGIGFVGGKRR